MKLANMSKTLNSLFFARYVIYSMRIIIIKQPKTKTINEFHYKRKEIKHYYSVYTYLKLIVISVNANDKVVSQPARRKNTKTTILTQRCVANIFLFTLFFSLSIL